MRARVEFVHTVAAQLSANIANQFRGRDQRALRSTDFYNPRRKRPSKRQTDAAFDRFVDRLPEDKPQPQTPKA
jgi:hypothetical protein